MYTVETFVTFEAAHRLYGVDTYSELCCTALHGHSYGVDVVIGRDQLNDAGMVIDFKLLKEVIRRDIEDRYDHSCILRDCDPIAEVVYANCKNVYLVESNPTAEWMAKLFFETLSESLNDVDPELFVDSVSVRETEHNIASYGRSNS